VHVQGTPDDGAVGKHVKIIVAPLAGRAAGWGTFEDQLAYVARGPTRAAALLSARGSFLGQPLKYIHYRFSAW
jgi:hypothetical protein